MLAATFSILASRGSALGKLLDEMGVPHWVIWVILGGWLCFVIFRRFANSAE